MCRTHGIHQINLRAPGAAPRGACIPASAGTQRTRPLRPAPASLWCGRGAERRWLARRLRSELGMAEPRPDGRGGTGRGRSIQSEAGAGRSRGSPGSGLRVGRAGSPSPRAAHLPPPPPFVLRIACMLLSWAPRFSQSEQGARRRPGRRAHCHPYFCRRALSALS